MIRYLALIVDLSEGLADKDFRPSRLAVFARTVETFITEFFNANPVSQLGLIVTQVHESCMLQRCSALSLFCSCPFADCSHANE